MPVVMLLVVLMIELLTFVCTPAALEAVQELMPFVFCRDYSEVRNGSSSVGATQVGAGAVRVKAMMAAATSSGMINSGGKHLSREV